MIGRERIIEKGLLRCPKPHDSFVFKIDNVEIYFLKSHDKLIDHT